jgi:DNA-binding transcriptional LysR family regulator
MVATIGSFNQAAELLDYAQSTVSDQIRALETDLGIKLFHREGKQISLTAAGELFLQYAQKMINLEEEARTEVGGSEKISGSLSIRIPETISTYYLPPVLNQFHARFPAVDFNFNSCSSQGLSEELRSGIIDCAFLITNEFRAVDLTTQTLTDVPLGLIAHPENPLAAKNNVTLAQLNEYPIFATTSDCSYFKILEKLFAEEKMSMSAVYRINSLEAIKRNIRNGTGIALLSKIAVHEEISKGLLVELPLTCGTLSAKMIMIWLKNKWHPPILEAFMTTMRTAFNIKK